MENTNPEALQNDLNLIIKLFQRIGLQMNKKKTKSMVIIGTPAPTAVQKREIPYAKWRKQNTQCNICRKVLKNASLQRHMENYHNVKPEQYLYREKCIQASFILDIEKGRHNKCPVPGCNGGSSNKWGMY